MMDINEDETSKSEVDFVALVDNPAIKLNWLKFSELGKQHFSVDEEKQVISGALMVADMPIYRNDKDLGEFYAMFSAETIEKIAVKFYQKGFQSNVNLMHDGDLKVEGATMFESWIVDRKSGKMPLKGFEDVADGSWFGSFKITNDAVWELIKQDKVRGFSVEGLFDYKPIAQGMSDDMKVSLIKKLLNICPNI